MEIISNTFMYLLKRKYAIITLCRIFEIVYVLNSIRSPINKKMIHLIFFHNPKKACLFIQCNFYCQIPYDPALAATEMRPKLLC